MKGFKLLLSLCLLLVVEAAQAQNNNIYVWDVTRSMIGKGTVNGQKTPNVYDKVENYLIEDIKNISIPSTRIIVIPFQEGVLFDYILTAPDATQKSKDAIIAQIKEVGPKCFTLPHSNTNIAGPIDYAFEQYQRADHNDKVVVLTDGAQNMAGGRDALNRAIQRWSLNSEERDYMVYVMTTTNAEKPTDGEVDKVVYVDHNEFKEQIVSLSLSPKQNIDFNINDMTSFVISFTKNSDIAIPDGIKVAVKSQYGCPLAIDEEYVISNGAITIAPKFDFETLKRELPAEVAPYKLQLSIVNADEVKEKHKTLVSLTPAEITLTIKYKRERILTVELMD